MALRGSPSNPETRGFRAFPYRCIRLLIKADFFAYAKITFPVKREGHFIGMLFFSIDYFDLYEKRHTALVMPCH